MGWGTRSEGVFPSAALNLIWVFKGVRGNVGIHSFEGASPIMSLFLLVWGVLELILKLLEGDMRVDFVGVSPSSALLLLIGANLDLTLGIIEGEWVIDDLCRGWWGCEVIGAISKFLSLLSILDPLPDSNCLSMSVRGTMFRYMWVS